MIGRYELTLYNNKVHYKMTITRNITVLRGDSASGKSEFIRLLTLYNSNPSSSGITLNCEKVCSVLNEENWKLFTETYTDRIFFIDEGNSFLRKKEFADAVKGADNYFVIVSRENLSQLPYSIEEIYGLREGRDSGKYHVAKRVYNEMYRIYGNAPKEMGFPMLVITEDSNSGHDYFDILFPGRCISANGKGNIKRMLSQHSDQPVLAIVDGAAFGPQMQECMELVATSSNNVSVFAPESFEFLILQSGIIEVQKAVLEETWNHADSVRFFSWEEFYTHYLADRTRNQVGQYSKSKLNEFYKTLGSVDRIKRVLPECIRKVID